MRYIFFLVLIFFCLSLNAQDLIIKANGEKIPCKVIEITPELIKFNKTSIKDGPLFSIYIAEVDTIVFSNGYKEVIDHSIKTEEDLNSDIFIDTRDGKEYKTIKIGKQTWFAENLAFETDNSWCYKKNDGYCDQYGRLYNFESAKSACPSGWHLHSDDEWMLLEIELGMVEGAQEFGWRGVSPGQGLLLKVGGGSGFEAKLAGYKNQGYWNLGEEAYFWTSSNYRNSKGYYVVRFLNKRASISREYKEATAGLSVRCIKD